MSNTMVFCRGCGKQHHETANTCPHCGHTNVINSGKSKTAATLFCFFLGGLGGHKFYVGQVGMGFLYLIFSWTFIPSLVALIEFIMLLCMSEEEFQKKVSK